MSGRPYVLLSVACSLDGYIDDASDERLLLSNDEDFDRVDEVRAGVDAILVGAGTIRADDPRLLVRSRQRRQQRLARGLRVSPIKVTLTRSGELDHGARFFATGDGEKLVYAPDVCVPAARERLGGAARVVGAGDPFDLHAVLADLAERNVDRLMIEGGASVHTLFLTADVVDELHLVYAPFFIGDAKAPRFVHPGAFPQGPAHPMRLIESRQLGDVVFLRYRAHHG